MLDALLAQYRQGDRRALARLLSLAARGEHLGEISMASRERQRPEIETRDSALATAGQVTNLPPHASRVVAVTGSAGVGKSTLVGKVIELLRKRGQSVAVLACDPQSPVSGGALLGDRFRMPSQPDDGVFIRSLAAAGGHGAVAEHLPVMIRLLERFGFDVVILETVGAGQGDTGVRELADVVVLLLQPEAGDELQWEKAGVLEVADVVAIQKADLPGAESTEAQVRTILGLSAAHAVPVVRVSAKTGQGVEELWETIAVAPLRRQTQIRNGHELLHLAQRMLAARFAESKAKLEPVLARYRAGELDETAAANEMLRILSESGR